MADAGAVPPLERVQQLPPEQQRALVRELAEANSDQQLAERWGVSLPQVRQFRRQLGIRKGSRGQLLGQPGQAPAPPVREGGSRRAPVRARRVVSPHTAGEDRVEETFRYHVQGAATAKEFLRRLEHLKGLLGGLQQDRLEFAIQLVSRPAGPGQEEDGVADQTVH